MAVDPLMTFAGFVIPEDHNCVIHHSLTVRSWVNQVEITRTSHAGPGFLSTPFLVWSLGNARLC